MQASDESGLNILLLYFVYVLICLLSVTSRQMLTRHFVLADTHFMTPTYC